MRREPLLQLWLAAIHAAAASLALAFAVSHTIAASYHLQRVGEEDAVAEAERYLRSRR